MQYQGRRQSLGSSKFRLQDCEGNVYQRLWSDVNSRDERTTASHKYIHDQRISHLDKILKLFSDGNTEAKKTSQHHKLNEALTLLQSLK